ncbi:MAG TPA: bifunctional folylpolyglutamate synthase/dihydrofolate synthase [Candidatus Fraserbacteria bacterium]|mgnify:CR=1 FL=1|nr:bifunctional folylpolyglutamate synthase/dihydrofolate synthase [Candidatus Fraserbacteria bacterium]
MNYREALAFIAGLNFHKVKPGLERTEALLAALGRPQEAFPAVQIAGTNGKGSVTALIASVCQQAGLRVGAYTSPHLISYRERIAVDGHPISREDFARLVSRLAPLLDDLDQPPTQFEFLTAMACEQFARRQVDLAVIEVGLGGRFDSTNVVQPLLSLITHIALDHTQLLGTTLREIAGEKAGIIRPGTPVITAESQPEALSVIAAQASQQGAPLVRVNPDELWRTSFDWEGQDFWSPDWGALHLGLLGHYEQENLALALAALGQLAERWPLSVQAVRAGIRAARWPGRFELLHRRPYLIVDGAHNVDSARALVKTLEAYRPFLPRGRRWLLFGVLADKDLPGICHTLFPHFDDIWLTRPDSERAADPEQLSALATAQGRRAQLGSLEEGLERAWDRMQAEDLLCVCGSLYLVGDLERLLGQERPLEVVSP